MVNLGRLQQALDAGRLANEGALDGAKLVAAGVLRRQGDGIRLLAKGKLTAAITIEVAGASKSGDRRGRGGGRQGRAARRRGQRERGAGPEPEAATAKVLGDGSRLSPGRRT